MARPSQGDSFKCLPFIHSRIQTPTEHVQSLKHRGLPGGPHKCTCQAWGVKEKRDPGSRLVLRDLTHPPLHLSKKHSKSTYTHKLTHIHLYQSTRKMLLFHFIGEKKKEHARSAGGGCGGGCINSRSEIALTTNGETKSWGTGVTPKQMQQACVWIYFYQYQATVYFCFVLVWFWFLSFI